MHKYHGIWMRCRSRGIDWMFLATGHVKYRSKVTSYGSQATGHESPGHMSRTQTSLDGSQVTGRAYWSQATHHRPGSYFIAPNVPDISRKAINDLLSCVHYVFPLAEHCSLWLMSKGLEWERIVLWRYSFLFMPFYIPVGIPLSSYSCIPEAVLWCLFLFNMNVNET